MIEIFEGIFQQSEIEHVYNDVTKRPVRFGKKGTDFDNFQYWGYSNMHKELQRFLVERFSHILPDGYSFAHGHFNIYNIGNNSALHYDGHSADYSKSILTYWNTKEWDVEWGGATIFYKNQNVDEYIFRMNPDNNAEGITDFNVSIFPEPGKTVMFDGDIYHSVTDMHPSCDECRVISSLRFHYGE